jgi:hydroxyacylglutathione hydrolase
MQVQEEVVAKVKTRVRMRCKMTQHGRLQVETIPNGPFVENCYILMDTGNRQGVLIDPGDEGERVLKRVEALGATIMGIYNTHAHLDHVGSVALIKRVLGVSFWLPPQEDILLKYLPQAAAMFGLPTPEVPTVDFPLNHGDQFKVGELTASVIATPGHSPGGGCFSFAAERVLISGDTLFARSIGRTDLPGGDHELLLKSIRTRLLVLPDDVTVYPGHGPATTIGDERRSNPFLA